MRMKFNGFLKFVAIILICGWLLLCWFGKPTMEKLQNESSIPTLYIITPTYKRPTQLPDMTRVGYIFKHVENIFWIVAEDASVPTPTIEMLLEKLKIPHVYLLTPMPEEYDPEKTGLLKPKGVSNRLRALEWIKANATDGVFYFADDDNTYDPELFEEMRYTNTVSICPVGLCTEKLLTTPIIRDGKVVDFYPGFAGIKWPIDMASFAVNVKFFLSRPNATMPYIGGGEENGFLESLSPFEPHELELIASECTKVLVWHTRTVSNKPPPEANIDKYIDTNLPSLIKYI